MKIRTENKLENYKTTEGSWASKFIEKMKHHSLLYPLIIETDNMETIEIEDDGYTFHALKINEDSALVYNEEETYIGSIDYIWLNKELELYE